MLQKSWRKKNKTICQAFAMKNDVRIFRQLLPGTILFFKDYQHILCLAQTHTVTGYTFDTVSVTQ
jgi:hypothetical protein